MAIYQIDDEPFLEISAPFMPIKALEIVERPGIDGTSFFDLGIRGQSCQIRTRCDYADEGDAADAFARYTTFTESEAVDITYLGISFSVYNVKYQVMDIQPLFIGRIAGGVGGLNPPSCGWVEAIWTLKPVPFTP